MQILIKTSARLIVSLLLVLNQAHSGGFFFGSNFTAGGGGGVAPTISHTTYCEDSSGTLHTTLACGALNMAGGHGSVALACWYDPNVSADVDMTLSDTATNSYTVATNVVSDNVAGERCEWGYNCNITGNASNVVAVTLPLGVDYLAMQVWELSGQKTSACQDVNAGATGTTGGTTLTSNSWTTAQSNELILGFGYSAYVRPSTWSSGTIGGSSATFDTSSGMGGAMHLGVTTTQTAQTAVMNVGAGLSHWGIMVASIKGL